MKFAMLGWTTNRREVVPAALKTSVSPIVFGFALVISEINLKDTLVLLLISVVLLKIGTLMADVLIPNLNSIGRAALGISVAIPLWTATDQLLRTTNFRVSALALLALLAVILNKILHSRSLTVEAKEDTSNWTANPTPFVVGLLATLLVAQVWLWLAVPACFALAVLLVTTSPRYSLKNRRLPQISITLGGMFLVTLLVARTRRATDWWLPGYGLDEVEILSHGAYEFGPGMDVFVSGIGLGYQWLNFAILGLFENISGANDFVIVSRFEFVAAGFLVSMLVWGFMIEFFGNSKLAIRASVLACLICTPMFYPSHYGLFTIHNRGFPAVFLIAIPFSVVAWAKHRFSWGSFMVLCIVTCSFLSMKSAAIVPLAVGLIAAAIMALLGSRIKLLVQQCLLGLFLIGALALTARNSSGIEFNLRKPFTFLGQFIGSDRYAIGLLETDFRLFLLYFLGFAFLFSVAGLAVVTTLTLRKDGDSATVRVVILTQLFTGAVLFIFANRQSFTHLHFLQIPVTATIVIAAVLASDKSKTSQLFDSTYGKLSAGIIALLAAVQTLYVVWNPQSLFRFSLPSHPGLAERLALGGVAATLAVGVLFVIFRLRPKSNMARWQPLQFLFSLLVVLSVTNGLLNWWTIGMNPTMQSGVVEGQLGNPDLQIVGNWFTLNTAASDVVASNHFFATEIPTQTYCQLKTVSQRQEFIELVKKQNYFTAVLLVKRRFAVAVPNYGSLVSGVDITARVTASLEYACRPNAEVRSALRGFGVNWYLAYTPGTSPQVLRGDTVRFRAGDYTVLQLYSA